MFPNILVVALLANFSLLGSLNAQSIPLLEFKSDGCSASPDGNLTDNWKHCCYEHDFLYWAGGTYEDRLLADDRLGWCISKANGPGSFYRHAVRVHGRASWGKAWGGRNVNTDLSDEELKAMEEERDVWISLGMPTDFEFLMFEFIVFKELDKQGISELQSAFQSVFHGREYRNFYRTYREKAGQKPFTELFECADLEFSSRLPVFSNLRCGRN